MKILKRNASRLSLRLRAATESAHRLDSVARHYAVGEFAGKTVTVDCRTRQIDETMPYVEVFVLKFDVADDDIVLEDLIEALQELRDTQKFMAAVKRKAE